MAHFQFQDELNVWGVSNEMDDDQRIAHILNQMKSDEWVREYTKAMHENYMVGTNLYRMEKAARRALRDINWLKESDTHQDEAELTKFGDKQVIDTYDEALAMEDFGEMFEGFVRIQLFTRMSEEKASGDATDAWHKKLSKNGAFDSWEEWKPVDQCACKIVNKLMIVLTSVHWRSSAQHEASAASDNLTITTKAAREFSGLPSKKEMETEAGDYKVYQCMRMWKQLSREDKTVSALTKAVSKHSIFGPRWNTFEREMRDNAEWKMMEGSNEWMKVDRFCERTMRDYPAIGFYAELYDEVKKKKQGAKESTRAFVRDMREKVEEAKEAADLAEDPLEDLKTESQIANFVRCRLRKDVQDKLEEYLEDEGERRGQGHALIKFDSWSHFEKTALIKSKRLDQ